MFSFCVELNEKEKLFAGEKHFQLSRDLHLIELGKSSFKELEVAIMMIAGMNK